MDLRRPVLVFAVGLMIGYGSGHEPTGFLGTCDSPPHPTLPHEGGGGDDFRSFSK